MNPTLKLALIGAAGYFLLKDNIAAMFGPHSSSSAQTPTTPAPPPSSTPPPAPPPPATTDAQGTKALMLNAAKTDANYLAHAGRMSMWQWAFYYNYVRGGTLDPAPLFPGTPAETLMTIDEWWAGATRHGLAGIPSSRYAANAWSF